MLTELLKEPSSWERLKNHNKPIILYGTGNGADAILDEFARLDIKIEGITASDGFVRKRDFRGFTVRSISEIEEEFHDFTVAVGFATCIPEVMDNIKRIAENHETIVPVVPVFGDNIFNREYVEKNLEKLTFCRSLLYDEESKRVFDQMVRFQYTGELSYLFEIESSREDALRNILELTDKEDMLDLGAYRGDTVQEVISLCGGISSAVALEPDRKSFEKLQNFAKDMNNITPLPYAVWNQEQELTFSGGGGRQSMLSDNGKYAVRAVPVDSIVGDRKFSYVKMDVEGAEKEAIEGMTELLRSQKPKLSIAAYHRTEDLTVLIPQIHSINPDYRIYLRHHPYIPCWDTNLYCV